MQCLCYLLYLFGLIKKENKSDGMASGIDSLINLFRTLNVLLKNLSEKRRKKSGLNSHLHAILLCTFKVFSHVISLDVYNPHLKYVKVVDIGIPVLGGEKKPTPWSECHLTSQKEKLE